MAAKADATGRAPASRSVAATTGRSHFSAKQLAEPPASVGRNTRRAGAEGSRGHLDMLQLQVAMGARRIFLARHGNRQDFVDPNWSLEAPEPYDPPLSADGVEQARRLGQRLRGEGIGAIVTSPFLRTVQTAHHANEALGLPIYLEPGFGEFLHARSFDRAPRLRALAELRGEYPQLADGYVPAWEQRYPETHPELLDRAQRALEALLDKLPGNLLVVGHAASVCALAMIDRDVQRIECPLCALFCLEYEDGRWRLSLDADIAHVGEKLAIYRYP